MRQRIRRTLATLLTILTVVGLYGTGSPAQASSLLQEGKLSLSDTTMSAGVGLAGTGVTYTTSFKTTTAGKIDAISINFDSAADSTGGKPGGLSVDSIQKPAANAVQKGGPLADWDVNNWTIPANLNDAARQTGGWVFYRNETIIAGADIPTNTVIQFVIDDMVNPDANDCTNNVCYATIRTYSGVAAATGPAALTGLTPSSPTVDNGDSGTATLLDQATVSFYVSPDITVTATVLPTLTFTVAGVNTGLGAGNEVLDGDVEATHQSFATSLPFGNLIPGQVIILGHDLTVDTNTKNGYIVSMKMRDQMTGIYGNTIDPFIADSGSAATWNAPAAWATPDGTAANDNSGWIGAHSSDPQIDSLGADSAVYGGNHVYGPVENAWHPVSEKTTPDDAQHVYVTFKLEVNSYQPADLYTGKLIYNCTPKY